MKKLLLAPVWILVCILNACQSTGVATETMNVTDLVPVKVLPNVYIDHVYVKVDKKSYAALRRQTWLQKWGLAFTEFDKKVSTWQGHYIQGSQSYLEILSHHKTKGNDTVRAQSGIGFYTEDPGTLQSIYQHLLAATEPLSFRIYDLNFGQVAIATQSTFAAWVVEPNMHFLKGDGISRRHWSEHFRAQAGQKRLPQIKSISEVHVELNDDEAIFLDHTLKQLNYQQQNDGNILIYKGPETYVYIYRKSPARGVFKVLFELDHPRIEIKKVQVGKMSLWLDGPHAQLWWSLN